MKYDIAIIGAGSGGLNIASFMNKAGFNVLLIDKTDKDIGGDCLNYGCILSKSLIHISKIIHNAKQAKEFDIKIKGKLNIKKVTQYIKEKQNIIKKHENAEYFRKKGIKIVLGKAKFASKNSIIVNNKEYTAKKIIIATFGLNEKQLQNKNYEKLEINLNEDRSITDNYPQGKLILYISKNKILGGTIIAPNAGEISQELILATSSELNIKKIFNKIYPYPTASRINKKIISNHFSKKLTPFNKKILKFLYH